MRIVRRAAGTALLFAAYLLVISPVGLVIRLFRDPLHRRPDSRLDTYWISTRTSTAPPRITGIPHQGSPARIRDDVRRFYNTLPFNYSERASAQARAIRRSDPCAAYPPLVQELQHGGSVLDVGCGPGWLANGIAFHHQQPAFGIDLSETAVTRARRVAEILGNSATFAVADLFQFHSDRQYDIVTSTGVLHHTIDCMGGVRKIAMELVRPGGLFLLGLYHSGARTKFFDHFRHLAEDRGYTEDALFEEFAAMRRRGGAGGPTDRTFERSWFRDQLFHPHESAHTLAEVYETLSEANFAVESTSMNRFGPAPRLARSAADADREFTALAGTALAEGRYFPGFFVVAARSMATQ